MVLYRLSFAKYIKEKLKEIWGISGRCKGDIFLNPSLKGGRDILREGVYEDHIIHAIRYLASHDGYGAQYVDLNAGFGAIACEILPLFRKYSLFEADQRLSQVLKVNMTLKDDENRGEILSVPLYPSGKIIARCERLEDVKSLLDNREAIIIFQNKEGGRIAAPHHTVYSYSAGMDKQKPFRTLWNLLFKGYAFRLIELADEECCGGGDYILLPKEFSI